MENHTEDTTERRAEDQDAAVEQAFDSGTLPESDRGEEAPAPSESASAPVVDRRLVRATARGFYGKVREIGEAFEIGGDEEVGAWMDVLEVAYVAPSA